MINNFYQRSDGKSLGELPEHSEEDVNGMIHNSVGEGKQWRGAYAELFQESEWDWGETQTKLVNQQPYLNSFTSIQLWQTVWTAEKSGHLTWFLHSKMSFEFIILELKRKSVHCKNKNKNKKVTGSVG